MASAAVTAPGYVVLGPALGWPNAYVVDALDGQRSLKHFTVAVGINGQPLASDMMAGDVLPPHTSLALTLNTVANFNTPTALQDVAARALFQTKRAATTIITGGPGTGKSWTRNMACTMARQKNIFYLCLAQNAVVARDMPSGLFGSKSIPPITVEMFLCSESRYIFPQSGVDNKALKRFLLIIDEYSMITASQLDAIMVKAKRTFRNAEIQLALFGDHHQLPPVAGHSPWMSEHLMAAMESTDASVLAVYELRQQQRFANDPAEKLVQAIVEGKLLVANEFLFAAAKRKLPPVGSCAYIAPTNAQLVEWNIAAHNLTAKLPNANETTFVAAKGNPVPPSFKLVNGMEITNKKNSYTKSEDEGIVYTDYNGLNGIVKGLTGGTVVITDTSSISIKLANGDVHTIAPKLMTLAEIWKSLGVARRPDGDVGSDGKRHKHTEMSKVWWFPIHQGPAKTVHIMQGATLEKGKPVVIDLARLPRNVDGLCMLYVAASRVQRFADLIVTGYEHLNLSELASACPCGCTGNHTGARKKLRSVAHRPQKLACYQRWLDTLLARRRAVYLFNEPR